MLNRSNYDTPGAKPNTSHHTICSWQQLSHYAHLPSEAGKVVLLDQDQRANLWIQMALRTTFQSRQVVRTASLPKSRESKSKAAFKCLIQLVGAGLATEGSSVCPYTLPVEKWYGVRGSTASTLSSTNVMGLELTQASISHSAVSNSFWGRLIVSSFLEVAFDRPHQVLPPTTPRSSGGAEPPLG